MKRGVDDVERRLSKAFCLLNDASRELAQATMAFKDYVRDSSPPPRRTRSRRSRSPVSKYSRTAVYVGKTTQVDKEELREQFEHTYGDAMLEFEVAKQGGHVRVVFEDEDAQLRCLKDASSWNKDYGIDVRKHLSRGSRE